MLYHGVAIIVSCKHLKMFSMDVHYFSHVKYNVFSIEIFHRFSHALFLSDNTIFRRSNLY